MKKIIALGVVAVLFASSAFACGNGGCRARHVYYKPHYTHHYKVNHCYHHRYYKCRSMCGYYTF